MIWTSKIDLHFSVAIEVYMQWSATFVYGKPVHVISCLSPRPTLQLDNAVDSQILRRRKYYDEHMLSSSCRSSLTYERLGKSVWHPERHRLLKKQLVLKDYSTQA